ncbi:response regulator [Lacticaseibacillus absianus]|uniref:response regulator n=1 Tax=Lacticaseibacillus absianus TaxID=2729623 RepID=UPI0015CE5460|nr:response regulator [Lacticaseibacillus absianus]
MKVLLVDDDRFVINVLKQTIDWPALGFSTVLAAANMRQAQTLLAAQTIDLIVSDIEMPQGSGLDLLDWLRHQQQRDTEMIFLTNYADFNYAQKAIELGSFDYYLKPIIPERFTAVLQKAVKKIRRQQQAAAAKAKAPVALIANDWRQVLHGQASPDLLARIADDYFLPILVQPELSHDTTILLQHLTAQPQTFGDGAFHVCFSSPDENHRLLILLQAAKHTGPVEDLFQQRDRISQQLQMILQPEQTHFALFVGTMATAERLPDTTRKLTAMSDDLAVHRNSINFLSQYHRLDLDHREPDLQHLGDLIAQRDVDALGRYCHQYLKHCAQAQHLSRRTLRNFREDLLQLIYVSLERHNIQAHKLFSSREYASLYLNSLNSIEIMERFIAFAASSAFSYAEFADSSISVARRLQNYIDTHLEEELTRDRLAEIVFLNPDYAAKLFKSEFGLSLTNYIIKKRIDTAQRMILADDRPINQIAESLGYTNFSYFTRLFKREVGLTPMAFRRQR